MIQPPLDFLGAPVAVGATVRTSYGIGPYRVESVSGPFREAYNASDPSSPIVADVDLWSLGLSREELALKDGSVVSKRKEGYAVNSVSDDDGVLRIYGSSHTIEVLS